jgi:hypothetical protein
MLTPSSMPFSVSAHQQRSILEMPRSTLPVAPYVMNSEGRACQCCQTRRNSHQLTSPFAHSAVKYDQLPRRKRIHLEGACW